MDETTNEAAAQANAMRNLLSQIGDPAAKFAAGVIDDEERIEQTARKMTYIAVQASAEAGTAMTDAEVEALLEGMRAQAALPTQEEQNAADIAYLMMTGGEWDV